MQTVRRHSHPGPGGTGRLAECLGGESRRQQSGAHLQSKQRAYVGYVSTRHTVVSARAG